jgi:DNA-directed RNA polymerase specialized sigma24 family protein
VQAALKPLRLVQNEPPGELETLFQTHHGRVFRTAQRITGSAADAEDVLQTVFLRLVKGQETYDLSNYEGLANKEIAVLLETSPFVVGVVLHRARTKLRKEIGHYLEKHNEKE